MAISVHPLAPGTDLARNANPEGSEHMYAGSAVVSPLSDAFKCTQTSLMHPASIRALEKLRPQSQQKERLSWAWKIKKDTSGGRDWALKSHDIHPSMRNHAGSAVVSPLSDAFKCTQTSLMHPASIRALEKLRPQSQQKERLR